MARKVIPKVIYTVLVLLIFFVATAVFIYQFKYFAKILPQNLMPAFVKISDLVRATFASKVKVIKEYCMECHVIESRFSQFHNPNVIGCTGCHLGNPNTLEKAIAHEGIIRFPGNLAGIEFTCGRTECHSEISKRVLKSIMTTMSGVVSVDKYAFGEIKSPSGKFKINEIGSSPADVHLRNLCASCHLGKEKNEFAQLSQVSRGGGCLACHLLYDSISFAELKVYRARRDFAPKYHPEISMNVRDIACFGCHSRSGRISTNYQGLMETTLSEPPFGLDTNFVQLQDGRVFIKTTPDVHFTKGISCIDCHTSRELMGNGIEYEHKEEQVEIGCADCHPSNEPNVLPFVLLDDETKKILRMRSVGDYQNAMYVVIGKTKKGFVNVYFQNNQIIVQSKTNGRKWSSPRRSEKCIEHGKLHPNLDCVACHTKWVPRCVSCHTHYDPEEVGWDNLLEVETRGCWVENVGIFTASEPTLGNVFINGKNIVKAFIPGMILKIDGSKFPNDKFQREARLYAPTFSHTISKNVPKCKECHLNPIVIGFGDGQLKLKLAGSSSRFEFIPTYPADDGKIAKDGWIQFKSKVRGLSTRANTYSLMQEQIQRILRVGSCFACHDWNTEKAMRIFSKNYVKQVKKSCILPS